MKNRSRVDIIGSILRTSEEGVSKTRITYGTYLSYTQLNEYLDFMMGRGLIQSEEQTRRYTTTIKGKTLLNLWDGIGSMLDAPGPQGPPVEGS